MAIMSILPVFAPALTTAACDDLIGAVLNLKVGVARAQGVKVGLRGPGDLIRIQGITRYALDLNRAEGLGFTIRRRRITTGTITSNPENL